MIFKIAWAADLCRSATVWFLSVVLSCHKFGESMFGKIITKTQIIESSLPQIDDSFSSKILTKNF